MRINSSVNVCAKTFSSVIKVKSYKKKDIKQKSWKIEDEKIEEN